MPRKKLNRVNLHSRVSPETPQKLKGIAKAMGFVWGNKGETGKLLDAIANGEILIVPKING